MTNSTPTPGENQGLRTTPPERGQIFICGPVTTFQAEWDEDGGSSVNIDRLGPFRTPRKPRVKRRKWGNRGGNRSTLPILRSYGSPHEDSLTCPRCSNLCPPEASTRCCECGARLTLDQPSKRVRIAR